jgi:uncharacterized repeat protein (TIGR03803 family)
MRKPGPAIIACLVAAFCFAAAVGSPAQTLTTLATFDGTDGANPYGALVQGANGVFYGTTSWGGPGHGGTIYKINAAGKLTTLYNFCSLALCADGNYPPGALVPTNSGTFYGVTGSDGAYGGGTVFNVTPFGILTTLYNFADSGELGFPSNLIQANDGRFYGTTLGYLFQMTPDGNATILNPLPGYSVGLMQGEDGNLYATTGSGGGHNAGTILKIMPDGTLTTLYSFCAQTNCTDGEYPGAALIQGQDRNFYGTTAEGGANRGSGTLFKLTPSGKLTTLYSFCARDNCLDGSYPLGLVQASDGNFYGVTYYGGNGVSSVSSGSGTIFEMTPTGSLTTLHRFCSRTNCSDGANPYAALLQSTNGNFYGTTAADCPVFSPCGTVFSLSVGLGPFVSFVHGSGKVGWGVEILGQGFSGTSGVSFSGTPANFKVLSDTLLQATVPAGAVSGLVTVTTPGGTLTSNKAFLVTR